MAPVLVVTNDFGPRIGGIESFLTSVCELLDNDVVVLTRTENRFDTADFDRQARFRVVRIAGPLLPTARVARAASELMAHHQVTRVLFGAAAPLGMLASRLREAGARRIAALTHGHEVWWSQMPATRSALRSIAASVDALGVISDYTAGRIAPTLAAADRRKIIRIPPPVDVEHFTVSPISPGPVVLAAGRYVRQKGFAALLDAWPSVVERVPDAHLRLTGAGPGRQQLMAQANKLSRVSVDPPQPHHAMAAWLQQGRVFALPVRSLVGGWYAEGLGLVFAEAAACGLPVVVGDSGGAKETVIPGVTGTVVSPDDRHALADAVVAYLQDPCAAQEAGVAGREYATLRFGSRQVAAALREALDL